MNIRRSAKPDPEVLSETVRTRLLERASELDAAYRAGGTVAELRAAAVEAGISAPAFDAALAELRDAEQTSLAQVTPQPRRRSRVWAFTAMVVGLFAVGSVGVSRRLVPTSAAPMVERTLPLRCLSPEQAAELVRPLLHLPENIVYSRAGVLTIRATPEQIENVRSVLNENENRASPACAR